MLAGTTGRRAIDVPPIVPAAATASVPATTFAPPLSSSERTSPKAGETFSARAAALLVRSSARASERLARKSRVSTAELERSSASAISA